jgi:hypothetical protein
MEIGALLGLFSIFIYFLIPTFAIILVVYIIKLMKQRNEYLKEIRDAINHHNKYDRD